MKIKKYNELDKNIWNEFCLLSKNQHFFYLREFMEYHLNRFEDHSLMFFDEKDSLIALLPANISQNIIYSHQGLTFGGLIIKPSIKQKQVLDIFNAIKIYLENKKISKLIYKKIPYIYNLMPSDEDLYSLFIIGAKLIRRDVSSSIKISQQIKYSKGRKWTLKKAKDENLILQESNNIDQFWCCLEEVLAQGHNAKPVHSLSEIKKLKALFPKNIKIYSAIKNGLQVAGAVIFETQCVAHTQYLYNTTEGREYGALDALVDHLVKNVYISKDYFDFGISNEQQGRYLNEGLIAQKEGFGARAVVHDFYEINSND